jgi:Glycosyl hydrolase catalytic core
MGAFAQAFHGVSSSGASRSLKLGIFDDGAFLTPSFTFPWLKRLHVKVIRVTMYWGREPGEGVAPTRPEHPTDPEDPAYRFGVWDRAVVDAADNGIKVVFSIVGTPRWASGANNWNRAPRRPADLRAFAYAAAKRYSGTYTPPGRDEPLPAVKTWLAWNEPNNPLFLSPQYRRIGTRIVHHKRKALFRVQSALEYAKICTAIWTGVHAARISGEKVGCGETGPRGNNQARSTRPSVSPLVFLKAFHRFGGKRFDAYTHHPYYGAPTETPTTKPAKTAIELGNLDVLIRQVTRFYGPKPIWITEYGYQTNPPDRLFGVTWKKQARYLTQAVQIARRNPRIDYLFWFLLRDEKARVGKDGWQSGLLTHGGKRKPAFTTFQHLLG